MSIRPPRSDDKALRTIVAGYQAYPAIVVGHQLGLYETLAEGSKEISELATTLKLKPRACEALVALASSVGILARDGSKVGLTDLAEDYLLKSSPTYWGNYFEWLGKNNDMFTVESIKSALVADSPEMYGEEQPIFDQHAVDAQKAADFTRWMHGAAMAPALEWPAAVDLSDVTDFFDIAGGSGAHSIGASLRYKQLKATVLDLAPVCEVTREYITKFGLDDRVKAQPFDMFRDEYPEGDVNFYSHIFHDWSREQCVLLAKKSLDSLRPGGRIIVHELFWKDDKTGPFEVAAINLLMSLLYDQGQQWTPAELISILEDAGFERVESKETWGFWGIVVGHKP